MGVCEVVFTIGNRTAAPDIELDLIISFGKKEL
jgi:hypothetical protein